MKILIDNKDGLGTLDYTACTQLNRSPGIRRQLNKPTTCGLVLVPSALGLKMPCEGAYLQVEGATGTLLFTGYLLSARFTGAEGVYCSGEVVNASIEAISDEIVLDTEVNLRSATLLGESAGAAWGLLSEVSTTAKLTVSLDGEVPSPSRISVSAGQLWTAAAQMLGDAGRTAYSAVAGQLRIVPIGAVSHSVSITNPGLQMHTGDMGSKRWTASDITVCGREEPDAYITEIFQADGVTTEYQLSESPFDPPASERVSIQDLFQGNSLNGRLWQVSDPGTHVSLTANGLTCSGGTGRDSETTVASLQQIELGGVFTLEGGNVIINGGSSGILLGLFTGQVGAANCLAGFQVTTSNGVTTINPNVNGASVGASFTPVSGSIYTYRVRVYSPETERLRQTYFYQGSEATNSFGGDSVPSVGLIEFEVQNVTSGIPGASSILYSGSVSSLPPAANLGLIDSGSLNCSIRSVRLAQAAPVWITTGQTQSAVSQLVATSIDGGACTLTSAGALKFYPANVPTASELIFVRYRSARRSIARKGVLGDTIVGGLSTNSWVGSVTAPAPLSSLDCENAAAALLVMASQPSSTLQGSYKVVQQDGGIDIWPGDELSITGPSGTVGYSAIVRTVAMSVTASSPCFVKYEISFANDWAENLSLKVSAEVPQDAVIPDVPTTLNAALVSLAGLTVQSVTASNVTISAGVLAPVNGGFEIRRRDATFSAGINSDLVLRSTASNITLPRSSAVEQFYIRMYDGSQPPNYSLHSAAVFLNVPI